MAKAKRTKSINDIISQYKRLLGQIPMSFNKDKMAIVANDPRMQGRLDTIFAATKKYISNIASTKTGQKIQEKNEKAIKELHMSEVADDNHTKAGRLRTAKARAYLHKLQDKSNPVNSRYENRQWSTRTYMGMTKG